MKTMRFWILIVALLSLFCTAIPLSGQNRVLGRIDFSHATKAEKTSGVWIDSQYVESLMHGVHQNVSALFLAAVASSGSYNQASRPQAARVQMQNQPQDQSAISTFTGKILSQNGERFILRDDVNETWYHLDDQQQAGKFLGKNVSVTGVLDQSTDTIRVRDIIEASA